jgi:ubiquinone/menaquinone biosynthesis C-methylase UbiE
MSSVVRQSKEQGRWNQLGLKVIDEIRAGKHVQKDSPLHWLAGSDELLRLLEPLQGKKILELGCGWGHSAVFLARKGARVTGVDIGPDLIAASKALAKVNDVECEFQTVNIVKLMFPPGSFDAVIGITILHHLSKPDVAQALAEVARVLSANGSAIFIEPVENSKAFDFIQNLLPAGQKGSGWYRPSILQRKGWNEYLLSRDNRVLTTKELIAEGKKNFRSVRISPYGFLVRLERIIGAKHRRRLQKLDAVLFKICPPLEYLSQTVLVEYNGRNS